MNSSALVLLVVTTFVLGSSWNCRSGSDPPSSFTLQFPDSVDLGELWLVEDVNCFTCGNGEKYLGKALGTYEIQLPAPHWYVSLKMPGNASTLLPHLAHPSLSYIGDIRLSGSDISDDDLKYLASINLRSIDLSKTKITGSGLRYLRPHSKWIFVTLRDCNFLDPQYLAHFRGWKRSTVTLVGHKWEDKSYTDRERKLLQIASQVICDGQPEDICGTQIR